MSVLYVAAASAHRAAAERALPGHGLDVSTVDAPSAVREPLSSGDFECVVVEHDAPSDDSAGAGVDRAGPNSDGLRVLEAVREADPAVPVVVFEREGASSIASDAISLDATEYVREAEAADPFATLADVCETAATSYRAEQDVAMVNELARNVYERITDGFFALNRDWEFTYLNAAAEDILDVDSEDVVGECVWDAFSEATEHAFYPEYQRAMATQEPVTFREHYPPLDKTFEVRAFPSENGLSVHFRTVVEGEPEGVHDNLLELTNVLSADLADSIDELRADLEAVREDCDCDDTDFDDLVASVDRLDDHVRYAVQLAGERPAVEFDDGE